MRATEDTPPFCAVAVLLAGAARRLLGVAIALPWGSACSRESFTQDSRSAVKARRYFRSVTRIIRRGALHASRQKTWRPRERPSRGFEPFVMRRKPVDIGADRGMRAYVTSGAASARRAQSAAMRSALRPHDDVVRTRARGSRRTPARRPGAARTAMGGDSGSGSGEGRRRCDDLQVPRLLRWQRSFAAGGAMVPVVPTGTRAMKHHAHGQSHRSRHSELAPRRIDPASSAGPLRR